MTGNCSLVLCGAPLASRAAAIAAALAGDGWLVRAAASPAAARWIDEPALSAAVAGTPITSYDDPRSVGGPHPDVVIVAPMTFNTLNKLAHGVADDYVSTKLCMALSRRTPIIAVPAISTNLGGHPILPKSLASLRDAGVVFVDPLTGGDFTESYPPGRDDEIVAAFDPAWLVERARAARR